MKAAMQDATCIKLYTYINISGLLCLLLLLAGCATVHVYPEQVREIKETRVATPELGVVTNVAAGEYMAQQQQCSAHIVPAIERPYRKDIGFAYIYVDDKTLLLPSELDGEKAYCSAGYAYFVIGERRSVCFIDTYSTGAFDKAYVRGTLKSTMVDVLIPYVTKAIPVENKRCYSKTVSYGGVKSGLARFTYQDDDKVTDFFMEKSIEIPVNKKGNTTFIVNGMEVEIHKADKSSIEFTIKSYFVE